MGSSMRYLMTPAMLCVGAAIAVPTVTSTRIVSTEGIYPASSGAARSSHTRAEKAEACSDRAFASQLPRVAVGPAATPDHTPDPVRSSAGVPLNFSDPIYANVTSGTSRIRLPPGSSRTDLSIVENSGDPTITCNGSCSLTRVRIQSREGVRCVSGDIDLEWVYVTATGLGSDHADGLQCYSPGSTGTVTVKNSTFKMAGAT